MLIYMLGSEILGSFEVSFFLITCLHSNLVLYIFHLPVYIINHMNAKNWYLVAMYLCIWPFEFLK